MLLLKVSVTLQPLAYMTEGLGMGVYDAFVPFLLRAFVGIVIIYILIRIVGKMGVQYVPAKRLSTLLNCSMKEAREISDYLDRSSISWPKYYGWVCSCRSRLMPFMRVMGTNDNSTPQLIATWGETMAAILKLTRERKLDRKWDRLDALGAVSIEVIKARQASGQENIFGPHTDLGED